MKLFFKHLLRSIARRPLQPIVLILTMMLSVAVSIMSFGLEYHSTEETEMIQDLKYGDADISIKLSSTSKSRFMFAEQAKALLGDEAEVAGVYELPMLLDNKLDTVFGVAVDFYEVGNIFSLEFTAYENVSSANLSEVALISDSFAKKQGLSVGDGFTAEFLGGEKSYTVGGISKKHFIGSYDVMVDITGVVRLLADDSILISALGDSFKPCSAIYVDLFDDSQVVDRIDYLRSEPVFSDYTIEGVKENAKAQANTEGLAYVIDIAIMLSVILTVAVVFCCFFIISAERTDENAVFKAAGAKPRMLNLMQYAEVLIYWFVGSVLGILLSIPVVRFMVSYAGFVYSEPRFNLPNVIKAVSILLLASVGTVTAFIFSGKGKRKTKKHNFEARSAIIVSALTAVLIIVLFAVPYSMAFGIGVVCVAALLLTIFCITPSLLKLFTRWLNSALDKKFTSSYKSSKPAFRYAVKNVYSVNVLHNFSRLVALLVAILVFTVTVILSTHGYVKALPRIYNGDYIVMNSTDACYGKVLECEGVERVNKLYVSGSSALVSASDSSAFSDEFQIDVMPEGNQAVVSHALALSKDARIGDSVAFEFGEGEIELVIIDIVETSSNFIIFDCESFGLQYNMLLVSGSDGVSSAELMQNLTEKTALEFATVASVDSLFETKLDALNIYLKSGNLLLVTLVSFALIAIIDNLGQSYRARKDEFELYRSCGMSARSVRRMKLFEVLISTVFGILLGLIISFIGEFVIQRGLLSLKYDTLRGFLDLFKY